VLVIKDDVYCGCSGKLYELTKRGFTSRLRAKGRRMRTPERTWLGDSEGECLDIIMLVVLVPQEFIQLLPRNVCIATLEADGARQQLVGVVL
jgi:hypothetical protein